MQSYWLVVFLVFSGLVIIQTVLMTIQTWEHRRFATSRLCSLKTQKCPVATGRAIIYSPCKGNDVQLESNLRHLFCQDYPNYEITFLVQDVDDPAYETICRLMVEYPEIPSRLVITGQATDSGQKVHNLRVGTASIASDIEYLVFVDSDAQPRPEWLRALLSRLHGSKTGAATGYRWFVPKDNSLASRLTYSINCRVAMLFCSKGPYSVWGGSWAIRRKLFQSLGIREAWQNTLSDDLVATNVLYKNGLRVKFEPTCMVRSPVDGNLMNMLRFMRRQYVIGRFSMPAVWGLAVLNFTLLNLVFWTSLFLTGWWILTGSSLAWYSAALCGTYYTLNVYRGWIRQDVARLYFPDLWTHRLKKLRHFDIWCDPLIVLVNWIGLLTSLWGKSIVWRGITYRLHRRGRCDIVARDHFETKTSLPNEVPVIPFTSKDHPQKTDSETEATKKRQLVA